jgi:hypothetical protein
VVAHGSENRSVIPRKSTGEPTIRPLDEGHEQELLTVYTDRFRAYGYQDEAFTPRYVVHRNG